LLLGSLRVKALRKMLMESTQGEGEEGERSAALNQKKEENFDGLHRSVASVDFRLRRMRTFGGKREKNEFAFEVKTHVARARCCYTLCSSSSCCSCAWPAVVQRGLMKNKSGGV